MKKAGVSFLIAFPAAGARGRALRPRLRLLLRAPHPHLLRDADARLRPDRLGHLLQVERGDGRRAGHAGDPLPGLRLGRARWPRSLPFLGGYRTSELLLLRHPRPRRRSASGSSAASSARPSAACSTTIRENPERAEFIGVNVRRYELAAFVLAGAFAGLAGGLFGIFNRGVFPDFAYWTKSSEVLIMTLLGGMGAFFGPALGAARAASGSTSRSCPTPSTGRSSSAPSWSCCSSSSPAGSPAPPSRSGGRLARRRGRVLEVRDLRKSFDGFQAVGGVSFTRAARARSAPSSAPTARARPRCST